MHTVHHTRAVIIKSAPSRESDKLFWLFTEEFGLVVAVATGVRKSGGKLKGHLVDYAFIDVDLVQGRDVWRLVSATLIHNPLAGSTDRPRARAYVRLLAIVERFLIGEGAYPELFEHVGATADTIRSAKLDIRALDTLAIWRALVHLGYVAVGEDDRDLFKLPLEQAVARITPVQIKKYIHDATDTIVHNHL